MLSSTLWWFPYGQSGNVTLPTHPDKRSRDGSHGEQTFRPPDIHRKKRRRRPDGPRSGGFKRRFDALIRPYIPEYFPVAWKMGLSISALILVGMTLLGAFLLNNQLERMRQQADRFGTAIATQLAHTAREPLLAEDLFLLKVHLSNLVRSESIEGAALFDRDGLTVEQAGLQPPRTAPAADAMRRWRYRGEAMSTYEAPVTVDENRAGTVAVTISDRSITAAQQQVRNTMITATLAMGCWRS
ncbi:hypothetical protein ASALC70_01446 [Alcanivorax sp. ALC70]|nr:hypothetical protein ASALC70_01446 [Alcanivorax sp. ALC70]